jgi:arginase
MKNSVVPEYSFLQEKTLSIIGVAVNEGQDLGGTELGPKVLREANLASVARSLGWNVDDLGDITNDNIVVEETDVSNYKYSDIKNAQTLGGLCKSLHNMCKKSAEEGNFTLVLGGDHGLASGSISGMKTAYPDLKVVWVDAHGDCNIPEASPSGNYHGMPVAHLFGWIPEGTVPGFDWFKPNLKPEDIAYIGLRDMDSYEKMMLTKHNIKVYDIDDVTELGIGKVMQEITEYFNADGKDHPIHVSFDIDGIDPMYAPQTGTKCRGGLTDREAKYILRKLVQTKSVVSMDLVEVNPLLEENTAPRPHFHGDNHLIKGTQTVCLGVELVEAILGHRVCK